MRIALTGASSGIGSVLVAELKKTSHAVFATPRSTELDLLGPAGPIANWIGEARPDVVIHLAGAKPPQLARALFAINAGATFAVLDAVRTCAPACRVIVASSAAIYGNPLGNYGASKLLAEDLVAHFERLYGLNVAVGRIFNAIGTPGDTTSMVPQTVARVRTAAPGETLAIRDAAFVRDCVHVADVARAFIAAAETSRMPRVFDIGTGSGTTVLEIAQTIVQISGKTIALESDRSPDG
ncbi:MAG: NAD(P)-dependent oxidoreductase, partial [Candidatus Baltobacteraceae bacterium]